MSDKPETEPDDYAGAPLSEEAAQAVREHLNKPKPELRLFSASGDLLGYVQLPADWLKSPGEKP